MSDDHSNLDKNLSKFQKKRGGGGPPNDYKQPKRNHNKDYQVLYESKGYEKGPRDQTGPGKGNYSPAYDDYGSKASRNDNYQSYKPKPHNVRQRAPNVWRKKTNKVARDTILETFSRVEQHKDIDKWLKDFQELFVKERQSPVNDDVFQLDPNEGLMAKTSRAPPTGGITHKENDNAVNTNAPGSGSNPNKPLEMFDFTQERHDPIQALRERLKGKDKPEAQGVGKEDQGTDELLEDEETIKALEGQTLLQQNLEGELGPRDYEELEKGDKELEDDEEEKYSDIDAMFERKLKNNEIAETFDDAFDDLLEQDGKKAQLAQMEDDERPVWEDLDTNKVIEEIKKEDFLSTLPQDKGTIFGKEYKERSLQEPNKQMLGEFGKEEEGNAFSNNFEIDFSKYSFDLDTKPSTDDFLLKHEDLFPSSFSQGVPQKQMSYPLHEGTTSSYLNTMGFGPMVQQGNMPRGPQNSTLINNMQPMYPFQQMSQMLPMQRPQQHMQQMGQMNSFDALTKMAQKYPSGNQPFMANQPNVMKREPGREMTGAGFPRQQINPTYPSFIFKYFVSNYDEKIWYYIDLQKRVQGPFSGKTMDEWYINGHLPLSLNVTIGKNTGYKTLKELADLIVNRSIGADEAMYQQPAETRPQMDAHQQGYSGISELLKNRPELAQFGANPQIPTMGKAKVLDEVEKGGPYTQYMPREQNFPEYNGGSQNYYQKGGPNGPSHGGDFEGPGYYQGQKNAPKKGGYPMMGPGGYPMEQNVDSPNKNIDNQMNKHLSSTQGTNLSNSPVGSNINTSADSSIKSKTSGQDVQSKPQDQSQKEVKAGNVEAPQNLDDMTNQLKNMLGLSIGGGFLGMGGNISNPESVENTVTEPSQKQTVEKVPEKVQQQPQYQEKPYQQQYYNYQQEKQEKSERQEKPERQEKQQLQPQRKGSKAPKIDTSDFPSLTETYK